MCVKVYVFLTEHEGENYLSILVFFSSSFKFCYVFIIIKDYKYQF